MVAPQRKIIHVDLDCFYAAVEVRRYPHLRGQPVAVGGDPGRRGVLSTCNYEARTFGLHSAMPTSQALRRCPQLQLLPGDMALYKEESRAIQRIFSDFTPLMEPLSLDEAFLDVTHSEQCGGSATRIAAEIRRRILEERGLTASAGIAPNKFLAKIASEWKKPNGQFTLPPDSVDAFLMPLPLKKLPGVGAVMAQNLAAQALFTCGDVLPWSKARLEGTFGSMGMRLYRLARGLDERPVEPRRERRSLSVERTFSADLTSLSECREALIAVFEEFLRRWNRLNAPAGKAILRPGPLFVKIKYGDFKQTTVEASYPAFEFAFFESLFLRRWEGKPVRLLGLGVRLDPQRPNPQLRLDLH